MPHTIQFNPKNTLEAEHEKRGMQCDTRSDHALDVFTDPCGLRRQLYHEATADQKAVLKGSRWLLLKNLNEQRDEATHLAEALKLNEPLATAYYLKEELRQFWDHTFR